MTNNNISKFNSKPSKGYPIYIEQPAVVNQALAVKVQEKKQEILSIIRLKNNR